MPATATSIRTARRVDRFTYAIRNIVIEAQKVERAGTKVRYLNIGDPIQFGFATPPHLIEAVARAMRDGHNNYTASAGILEAREAVAADFTGRGVPVAPDRVLITSGTSEGLELALTAIVNEGESVLVPSPTYPLYTAVLAKIGAEPLYYRTDPSNHWLPDLDHMRSLITHSTRALVVIDPNNPTGAVYPESVRRALIALGEEHGLMILADEVYGDLAYSGSMRPVGDARSGRSDHFVFELVESVSGTGMACRLDGRWRDAAARRRACGDQEAGGWAALQPRADAVRRRRSAHRRPIAPGDLSSGAPGARRADDHAAQRDRWHFVRCTARGVLCHAASGAAGGANRRRLRPRACSARPGFFAFMVRGLAQSPPEGSSGWSSSRR